MNIKKLFDIKDLPTNKMLWSKFIKDFDEALITVKPSINEKSIEQYMEWNKNFGSFQIENDAATVEYL